MKLISENQTVGNNYGYAVIRDLYETDSGERISVQKSAWFDVGLERERPLDPAKMIAKHPIDTFSFREQGLM